MERTELLGVEDVSARLRISECSVYRLVRLHKLEYAKVGRCLRFRPEAVEQYIERCTVAPHESNLQ
jgi:excisionase family DNA binding protein